MLKDYAEAAKVRNPDLDQIELDKVSNALHTKTGSTIGDINLLIG